MLRLANIEKPRLMKKWQGNSTLTAVFTETAPLVPLSVSLFGPLIMNVVMIEYSCIKIRHIVSMFFMAVLSE
jgi:hypothetical protein